MRLILCPCHSSGATARLTDIWRRSSSGSKSEVVLPSSMEPIREIAPARKSRASLSVVLPAPPCENKPTLRSCPWVMLTIILVNILAFIFELGVGDTASLDRLFQAAGVVPVEFTRNVQIGPPPPLNIVWLTLITSMFLHGGLLHIGSNMLYL